MCVCVCVCVCVGGLCDYSISFTTKNTAHKDIESNSNSIDKRWLTFYGS